MAAAIGSACIGASIGIAGIALSSCGQVFFAFLGGVAVAAALCPAVGAPEPSFEQLANVMVLRRESIRLLLKRLS